MSEVIKTTRKNGIFHIILDRPKANAIDLETSRRWVKCLKYSVMIPHVGSSLSARRVISFSVLVRSESGSRWGCC